MSARSRRMLSAGWRVALVTAIVGSSLLYSYQLTATPHILFDFKGGLYNAGLDILHGHDPYRPAFLAHQAAILRSGGIALGETTAHAFSVPLYPAPANLAVIPFSVLPFWLAGALFTLISLAAIPLALSWLGVRDWRCVALALVSWPCLFSLWLGAMGPLLLLGAAAAWRWRDHVFVPALSLAAMIAAKLFPWPLAIWLLATRRWRALALTVGLGGALLLGGWALLGFSGMAQYPKMLSDATFIQQGRASSLVGALLALGLSSSAAHAAALLMAAALLLIAWRRGARGGDGDRQAFGLAVLAALCASPIVWDHYLVLLFIPIAMISPRLSPIWFIPTCTPLILVTMQAIAPARHEVAGPHSVATLRNTVLWLVLEAIIAVRLVRSGTWDRMPAGAGTPRATAAIPAA